MIGIGGLVVILHMAVGAIRRQSDESSVSVTVTAFGGTVSALEAKIRPQLVVPRPSHDPFPALWGVAFLAMIPELQTITVILSTDPVALFTRLRRPLENAVEMAITAIHGAMSSH
jgi:hypothetical protein